MEFKEEILTNQLKIVFFPLPHPPTTALLLFVNFGTRFEDSAKQNNDTQGLATFTANTLLRGSQKYPDDLLLGEALDNLGAYFNVEVHKEYSAFYLKITNDQVIPAVDFLAEILSHPVFSLAEIDREKKLCQGDITNRGKNPSLVTLDNLTKLIYKNHPLSYSGIASRSFLDNLRRDDLINYHKKYYTGSNMTLVMVGSPEVYQKCLAEIKNSLLIILSGQKNTFLPFDQTNLTANNQLMDFEADQIYMAFGYPGYPRNHTNRYILELIETILGKGRANKRFLPLYLTRSPASYVTPTSQFFSDFGFFLIQAAAPAVNIKYAYQKIIEEIELLKAEKVKDEELSRVKKVYLGNLLIQIEEPVEYGFFHSLQYLFNNGQVISFNEVKEKVNKLTAEEIQKVAGEVLDQTKIFVSMVGKEVTKIR